MRSFLGAFCLWSACLALAACAPNAADPVKLTVFYESLCSDSKNFVVNQMYPTWEELQAIMSMNINVYGKINETKTTNGIEFSCQHGPNECTGNMMLNCAKKYLVEDEYLAFSNCIMEKFNGTAGGRPCAEKLKLNYDEIDTCWQGEEGPKLLHQAGQIEHELDPPLTYVPWILINDVYTLEQRKAAEKDLKKVICDAYKGVKPSECSK